MDPFLGEIRMMGFGITPKGWLPCNGQLLSVNANQALFSLLGTIYGGDGRTTFALPDLRSRAIVGAGQGPGLQNYGQGQRAGTENVTLLATQMPPHLHPFTGTIKASADEALDVNPGGQYPAKGVKNQFSSGPANGNMNGAALGGSTTSAGGSQPHENRQPAIAMNYCIATVGIYPSRG